MKLYRWLILIVLSLMLLPGCRGNKAVQLSRTAQDYTPPVFNSIQWPDPYSVLQEGSLGIAGNVGSEAGIFEEMPLAVNIFPVPLMQHSELFLDPDPVPTYQELRALLMQDSKVQEWLASIRGFANRRVTEGQFFLSPEELTRGMQMYPILPADFNEYEYFDFESGDFRIDFEHNARLKSGYPLLLILCAIDSVGNSSFEFNIYRIEDPWPYLDDELKTIAAQFSAEIASLGFELAQVFVASGDNRALELQLMPPYLSFIENLYSDYSIWRWDAIAEDFLTETEAAAGSISDPDLREAYIRYAEIFADIYKDKNYFYWTTHYILLDEGEELIDVYQQTQDLLISRFEDFNIVHSLEDRGGGVKSLTVVVYEDEEVFAQLQILGDPSVNLLATGFIGEHQLVPADYDAFFFDILEIFIDEDYPLPIGV